MKFSFKTFLTNLNWSGSTQELPEQRTSEVLSKDEVLGKVDAIIHANRNASRVAVITPTIGSSALFKAMESVQNQDHSDLTHFIVVDGVEFAEKTDFMANQFESKKIQTLVLPENTGQNGMNGHRIYAALPFLLNAEYIFFLDQDNWFDANHISSMVSLMEHDNLDWVYSMRKICKESGDFVTNDNCESLGEYPCYSRLPNLVDTNCYGFRRNTLVKSAHYWYHPLQADRYFFHHLKQTSPNFKSTGLYTVNYRLTEHRPPSAEFFLSGNRHMFIKYNGKLPWLA